MTGRWIVDISRGMTSDYEVAVSRHDGVRRCTVVCQVTDEALRDGLRPEDVLRDVIWRGMEMVMEPPRTDAVILPEVGP